MSKQETYCPECGIGLDYYQMKAMKCNNCLHSFEIIHVTPNNDLKPHYESYQCHCEPSLEIEGENMVCVHNAFDGREGLEQANEILNNSPL